MKLFYIFLILGFSASDIFADCLTKSVKDIYAGNYADALPEIKKCLEKNPTDFGLHFLIAKYYAAADNPAGRLDSANLYATGALNLYPGKLGKSKLKKYAEAGIRPFSMRQLLEEISERAFEQADSLNTLEQWESFVHNFPQSPQLHIAV